MAKSSGIQSQQQPASPQQAATALPEPKLVAASEVIGRELSVFQTEAKPAEWWDGKVTEFKSDSGQHLVRYHGREHRTQQWLQLSDQPFQWKSTPPSSAPPNPTVKGVNLNDSILGRKVKVFWPMMSKWYLGHIKEYDTKSGRHTIKYKDGEVKDYALRHEAIWWLDTGADVKVAASSNRSKPLSTGSHSGNQDARKQPAHSTGRTAAPSDSPKHRQKQFTAPDVPHTDSPANGKPSPAVVDTAVENAAALDSGAASPKRRQKTVAVTSSPETGSHSSLSSTGHRRAMDVEDGSVSQSSCSRGPAETAFPDMHEEEEQTQGPSSRHAPNPAAKPSRLATLRQGRSRDWTQLAGESKAGRRSGTPREAEATGGLEEAGAGESIVGARVGIFWADDEIFYKGELSGFDAYHKRSKVCYDDGQEEWVSLLRESFRWYTPRGRTAKQYNPRMRDIMLELGALDLASQPPLPPDPSGPTQTFVPDQRPGLSDTKAQSDSASTASAGAAAAAIPTKDAAVGWAVSVWSHAEGRYVRGQVIAYGKRHRHHVLYGDGEDEWLKLAEEHVQWHGSKCSIAQTAGLQKGTRTPKGLSAVGWRIGVYWTMDQEFYYGRVMYYDKDEETQHKYQIKYDDEEEEDVDLTEQAMKWVLPPSVAATSEASEDFTPRLRKKPDLVQTESARARRQPVPRRHAHGRGVERQKSRLGINRSKSGIRKESAATPKLAPPLLSLPLFNTSTQNASLMQSDPSSPVATAAPTITTAVAAASLKPVLLHSNNRQPSSARRHPSLTHVGSKLIPRLDRIIGPAPRRAPHLAGTRVKIYCSQAARGVKSNRLLSQADGQDANARRVRRRLEAVNQMIWRCECADTAITKGAPVPFTAPTADAAMHLLLPLEAAPVPGTTVSRVVAHLGIPPPAQLPPASLSSSLPPASQQLPTSAAAADQPPLSRADNALAPQQDAAQPDETELIHQLPGSAPMLLDDKTAMLLSVNHAAAPASTGLPRTQPDTHPDTKPDALATTETAQRLSPYSRHVSPRAPSRSPSGSLLGLCASRQGSPSSASLAELVPSTTAVTVPPYNVISAAKASSAQAQKAPVVRADDAAVPTAEMQEGWCGRDAALAVKVGLRGQESVGVPDTPNQENLVLVLNRERSSLSKDQAEALSHSDYMHSYANMSRKSQLSASGMLDLAMSDAPPGDIEPEMFAFLLDNDAFGSQKSEDPSSVQG